MNKDSLKGKRIAGIDYGKRRIGVSVCDIYHITVTPKLIIENNGESVYDELIDLIKNENIEAIVVGVPYREDDKNKKFIEEIKEFITKIGKMTGLKIFEQDESYSTIEAVETMIKIGYGKRKRREKGNKDRIASAIILRNYLNTIE